MKLLRGATRLERRFDPSQSRDSLGRWIGGGSGAADLIQRVLDAGRGGDGGSNSSGASRVCTRMDDVSIDGIVCLYKCPDGEIAYYPSGAFGCFSTIFSFEGFF